MESSPCFLVAMREARTLRLAAQGLKMLETLVDDRNKDRLHSNGTWVKWAHAAPEATEGYWRLQHFYCRMREHICQEKAVDAQKVFKESIWGAKDPEKRGLAHRALQPADIDECIFDWVHGLQAHLKTIVDAGSVPPAAQAIRNNGDLPPDVEMVQSEPAVPPWTGISAALPDSSEPCLYTVAVEYISSFPPTRDRPESYVTHADMLVPLLSRPVPDHLALTARDVQEPFLVAAWQGLGLCVQQLRHADKEHKEWLCGTAKSKLRATVKPKRDPLCATANALREFDAQAREYEKQVPGAASRHQLLVIQHGVVVVMGLLQHLQAMVKERRRKVLAATRQLRSSNKTAEFTKMHLSPMLWMCPATCCYSWEAAREAIYTRTDSPDDAWCSETLLTIARCLEVAPVVRLKDLKKRASRIQAFCHPEADDRPASPLHAFVCCAVAPSSRSLSGRKCSLLVNPWAQRIHGVILLVVVDPD